MSVLEKTLLTTVGAAKYAYNDAHTLATNFYQIALGDNNGSDFIPAVTDGACVHEVYRANINSITIDPVDPTIVILQLVLPVGVGGFTVREARVYDIDGVVMYTANPYFIKSLNSSDQNLLFRIKRSSTSAVTLLVDPSITLASQLFVNNAINTHNIDAAAHAAANFVTKANLQANTHLYADAAGTTTAYTASLAPAPTVLTEGMRVVIDTNAVGTNSTTTPTFNLNGLTAHTITLNGSAALRIGDLPRFAELIYNATDTKWELLNPAENGKLIGVQVFKAAGTFTYTPTAGTRFRIIEGAGGGAGGGATYDTGAGNSSVGGGGGAGEWKKILLTTAITGTVTVTIGAGGAGGINNTLPGYDGSPGGATSFGAYLTLGGGLSANTGCGLYTNATTNGGVTAGGAGGSGGSSSGTTICGGNGMTGGLGFVFNRNQLTGKGGDSPYGAGGYVFGSANLAGVAGLGNGSGGSGSCSFDAAGTGYNGGAGAPGIIIVWEYS
jgi:uncharacterized membrane protein YgcG